MRCSRCNRDLAEESFTAIPVRHEKYWLANGEARICTYRTTRGRRYVCNECLRHPKPPAKPVGDGLLLCARCRERKDPECFGPRPNTPRGRKSYCKLCCVVIEKVMAPLRQRGEPTITSTA